MVSQQLRDSLAHGAIVKGTQFGISCEGQSSILYGEGPEKYAKFKAKAIALSDC